MTVRESLASSLAALACGLLLVAASAHAETGPAVPAAGESIRPFRIRVPEAALADLRRRIGATRCPWA